MSALPTCERLVLSLSHDDRLLTVRLAGGKGNIVDAAMMKELRSMVDTLAERPGVRAVLLTAEGKHFSFGASVAEHAPENVREMLGSFHGLCKAMVAMHVPLAAAIRGQCLGGGMEIATLCHWIFASPTAAFGQPEVQLGVFAPVASTILARQIGGPRADDLLLTGRTIDAETALAWGLVHTIDDDPDAAAIDFLEKQILPRSGVALRFASRAARADMQRAMAGEELDAQESLYFDELMATEDACEGIASFMERRKPAWRDR